MINQFQTVHEEGSGFISDNEIFANIDCNRFPAISYAQRVNIGRIIENNFRSKLMQYNRRIYFSTVLSNIN